MSNTLNSRVDFLSVDFAVDLPGRVAEFNKMLCGIHRIFPQKNCGPGVQCTVSVLICTFYFITLCFTALHCNM